jgi:hypothetical protein
MRNVLEKSCRESKKTHFMLNNFFLKITVYEIIWKNVMETEGPQMTLIWRIACCISMATCTYAHEHASENMHAYTHTHNYVILTAFPRQKWIAKAPQCYVARTLSVLSSFFSTEKGDICYVNTNSRYTVFNYVFWLFLVLLVYLAGELQFVVFQSGCKPMSRGSYANQVLHKKLHNGQTSGCCNWISLKSERKGEATRHTGSRLRTTRIGTIKLKACGFGIDFMLFWKPIVDIK